MSHDFSLSGKNALITGGTRGIGLAIARGFLSCGCQVTICSRKQASVDAALEQLSEFSGCLQGVVA
ncbi:MAG: SDR family NAD(P)-dependent oxidoreductase, partial [Planctomycetaceae bacterium]